MNRHILKIQTRIEPLRQQIINHEVYSAINDIDDLKVFMQYHVFAVWDFMSLLKALQNNLTCTTIPWFPKGSADTRHLINEIVVGEESDVDLNGERKSHFELYLDAMKQCEADTSSIELFTSILKTTNDFDSAFSKANVPKQAIDFVNFTFQIIQTNKSFLQSAIFTFGREDLIPSMFHSIVKKIDKNFPGKISTFNYYLERHIEVDGNHHSHLALQMTSNLCENNEQYWDEAETVIIQSLQKRIDLWDGVLKKLKTQKQQQAT